MQLPTAMKYIVSHNIFKESTNRFNYKMKWTDVHLNSSSRWNISDNYWMFIISIFLLHISSACVKNVKGFRSIKFYTIIRPNQERKIQLYALWKKSNLPPCESGAALGSSNQMSYKSCYRALVNRKFMYNIYVGDAIVLCMSINIMRILGILLDRTICWRAL